MKPTAASSLSSMIYPGVVITSWGGSPLPAAYHFYCNSYPALV